jgi:hypothetical protein
MAPPTAVLVDGQNIVAAEGAGPAVRFEELLSALRRRFGRAARISVFITAPDGRTHKSRRAFLSAADVARVERAALAAAAEVIRVGRDVDLALAVHGMEEVQQVEKLVLVSGDSDFVPLLKAARKAGVWTVVVSPLPATGAALAVAADELIQPGDLVGQITGLIAPGDGEVTTAGIIALIQGAGERVAVIDPWISERTIRLLAWSGRGVNLILVTRRFPASARAESADMAKAGRNLALYETSDVHDRWLAVDDRWWHSGGSLKDLGRKWTRISELHEPQEIELTEQLLVRLAIPANALTLA